MSLIDIPFLDILLFFMYNYNIKKIEKEKMKMLAFILIMANIIGAIIYGFLNVGNLSRYTKRRKNKVENLDLSNPDDYYKMMLYSGEWRRKRGNK